MCLVDVGVVGVLIGMILVGVFGVGGVVWWMLWSFFVEIVVLL